MALFRLDSSVLNGILNDLFNATDITQYKLQLGTSGGVISGLTENCSFANAVYDSVNKLAYVDLDATVFFTIPSGTTIDRLYLSGDVNPSGVRVYIVDELITERVYTSNGTYTVSNFIIKLGI